MDPRKLLLSFMAMATPSEEVAASILNNPNQVLEKIQMVAHDWLQDPEQDEIAAPTHVFTGVPDAISDVKGRMVYAQTPAGLELAWKVSLFYFLFAGYLMFISSKSRWRITGTTPSSRLSIVNVFSLLSIGLPTLLYRCAFQRSGLFRLLNQRRNL